MKNNELSEKKPSKFKRFGDKTLAVINKMTSSTFVSTIMESFILVMPIIITSTIFILAAELAPAFGFQWRDEDGTVTNQAYATFSAFCYRMYNLSYGILGLALCVALASRLTEKINPKIKSNRKMSPIIVCISAIIAYLLFGVPNLIETSNGEYVNALDVISSIFGAKGIFTAMLTGLTVPWIFLLCYKFNITIRLPKQVPQNISQAFLNIFPLMFTIIIYGVLGWVFVEFLGDTMLNAIFNALTPLLDGARSYWFFIVWSMVLSLTWFCGIHTSVWSGITDTLSALGIDENVASIQAGQQATNLWPDPFKMGAFSMGGTGAQIAVPIIIILFCKSKQLKSIGFIAIVPILFQVNEPILFGLPSILNPLMLLPFLLAPLVNTIIGVIFVLGFGMNASSVAMPWSMPTIIAVPIASRFEPLSFILPLIWFGVSFGIWMPFVLIQDKINYKKELLVSESDEYVDYRNGAQYLNHLIFNRKKHLEIKKLVNAQKAKNMESEKTSIVKTAENSSKLKDNSVIEILVICIGAGTSAMLAEIINSSFANSESKIIAKACSSGNYGEYIDSTNIVIISPQARMISNGIEEMTKSRKDLIVYQTKGPEFLEMINDKNIAKQKVNEKIKELKEKK